MTRWSAAATRAECRSDSRSGSPTTTSAPSSIVRSAKSVTFVQAASSVDHHEIPGPPLPRTPAPPSPAWTARSRLATHEGRHPSSTRTAGSSRSRSGPTAVSSSSRSQASTRRSARGRPRRGRGPGRRDRLGHGRHRRARRVERAVASGSSWRPAPCRSRGTYSAPPRARSAASALAEDAIEHGGLGTDRWRRQPGNATRRLPPPRPRSHAAPPRRGRSTGGRSGARHRAAR